MNSILEEKRKLRAISERLRKKTFNKCGRDANIVMTQHFKCWFKEKTNIKIISFYFPIKTEVDPFPLIEDLRGTNLKLCLPVVEGTGLPLSFKEWTKDSDLIKSSFGTRIPARGQFLTPDLIIAPLLAFDKYGSRLGYGGGFYDRTIDSLRSKKDISVLGLAFECQRTTSMIPVEPTDQKMDWVLTERGLYSFNSTET